MKVSVKQIVDEEMQGLGFKREKSAWYRARADVVHVVGLQKSSWGQSYYINLGVWVSALAVKEFPKPRECHLQCRIDLISEMPNDLEAALNEEDYWRMDADHRREVIRLALCSAEFTFFRELESGTDVRAFVAQERIPQLAVARELRVWSASAE
jgi:hypothetical protein